MLNCMQSCRWSTRDCMRWATTACDHGSKWQEKSCRSKRANNVVSMISSNYDNHERLRFCACSHHNIALIRSLALMIQYCNCNIQITQTWEVDDIIDSENANMIEVARIRKMSDILTRKKKRMQFQLHAVSIACNFKCMSFSSSVVFIACSRSSLYEIDCMRFEFTRLEICHLFISIKKAESGAVCCIQCESS